MICFAEAGNRKDRTTAFRRPRCTHGELHALPGAESPSEQRADALDDPVVIDLAGIRK
jgi:hypothetical protein